MKRSLKNVAASVHQRLLNRARETGRPFNELLQYYVMERFLYRMSKSSHSDQFVLKGALMMNVWRAPVLRPTRDIDLLGRIENSIDAIVAVIQEVCIQKVEQPDGVSFDPLTVSGERITEDAIYEGLRVRFRGCVGKSEIPMQLDVGFGDKITPSATVMEYPTILGHPAPRLKGYSRETTIAEKLQAMVKLGELNSRMRDFYDIWLLSQQFDFDGKVMGNAIKKTFSNRRTDISTKPIAFTESFASDSERQRQWAAFLRRSRLDNAPGNFQQVIETISVFLLPITTALSEGKPFKATWVTPGPWQYGAKGSDKQKHTFKKKKKRSLK